MFPFYTSWKHQKNVWFSYVFMAYKIGTLTTNGLALKKHKDEFGFDYVLNLLRIAFVEINFYSYTM